MDTFKLKYGNIINAMLAAESPSTIGEHCSCGIANALQLCHCNDCNFFEPCCAACFIMAHLHNPITGWSFGMGDFSNARTSLRLDISSQLAMTFMAIAAPIPKQFNSPLSQLMVSMRYWSRFVPVLGKLRANLIIYFGPMFSLQQPQLLKLDSPSCS